MKEEVGLLLGLAKVNMSSGGFSMLLPKVQAPTNLHSDVP